MGMSDKGDLRTASDREACGINVADRPIADSWLAPKRPLRLRWMLLEAWRATS